jgi:hypothetical protein
MLAMDEQPLVQMAGEQRDAVHPNVETEPNGKPSRPVGSGSEPAPADRGTAASPIDGLRQGPYPSDGTPRPLSGLQIPDPGTSQAAGHTSQVAGSVLKLTA